MADQQVRAEPVEQPDKRRRFTLPSAYTILFALIVLMAIAGGRYWSRSPPDRREDLDGG